jgi:CRP-like cAMP-binding protein
MTTADDTPGNRLLSALSAGDYAVVAPHLERVEMEVNEIVARKGERFTHAYFPVTALISVVNRMSDGTGVEVGTVGNEGMAGIAAYLGVEAMESETFCQVPGVALRLPMAKLLEAAAKLPALSRLLNRYTQAYLTQVAQSTACNRLHGIEQRCARWLLMTHDRVNRGESFPLKQQFLAEMLGVRRAGVTVAAGALQDAGIISYRRGVIRVLDRAGLEAASCECYGVVRQSFDRIIPDVKAERD